MKLEVVTDARGLPLGLEVAAADLSEQTLLIPALEDVPVEVPPGSRLVYVSGTVPEVADASAPQGSVARYGDTAAQTRSVLRRIEALLREHRLTLRDVVMMRVFLVAPPGQPRMDFAGMMTAYREFFGTPEQPERPARSTMQVAGLVDPGWLVEIEVTAARHDPTRMVHPARQ